jgi:hypothetical protein
MLGGNTPDMQNQKAQHLPAMMLCSSSAGMIFFFQLKNKNLILERLRSSLNINCSRVPQNPRQR